MNKITPAILAFIFILSACGNSNTSVVTKTETPTHVAPTQTTELLPTVETQNFPTAIPPMPELNSYPVDGRDIAYLKLDVFTDLPSIINKGGLQFGRMIGYYIPALQIQFPNEVIVGDTIEKSIENFFKVFEVRGYADAELGCAAMVPYHREQGQFYVPIVEGVRALDLMVHQDFMDSHKIDGSGLTFIQVTGTDIACSNKWPIIVQRYPDDVGNTMYLVTNLTRLPIDTAELTVPLEMNIVATDVLQSEVFGLPVTVSLYTDKTVRDAYPIGDGKYAEFVKGNPDFKSKVTGQMVEEGLPDAYLYGMYLAWQKNFDDLAINAAHAAVSYETYVNLVISNDPQAITPIYARDWNNPKESTKRFDILPEHLSSLSVYFADTNKSEFLPYMDYITLINDEVAETMATLVRDGKPVIILGLPGKEKYKVTYSGMATSELVTALSRLSNPGYDQYLPKDNINLLGKAWAEDYILKRLINFTSDGKPEQYSLRVFPQY